MLIIHVLQERDQTVCLLLFLKKLQKFANVLFQNQLAVEVIREGIKIGVIISLITLCVIN